MEEEKKVDQAAPQGEPEKTDENMKKKPSDGSTPEAPAEETPAA